MNIFIRKIATFISPIFIIILVAIVCDFFKVLGFHDDYYKNTRIGLNREMICTKTYNNYRDSMNYDSFIFGSSRSRAYKCKTWQAYIHPEASPFHFDASGEGIGGISQKVQYIHNLGDTIRHALVILDRTILKNTEGKKGHLYISMPCVSKESEIEYYFAFIKASANINFLVALLDYSVFSKHRPYMGGFIVGGEHKDWGDPITCDYWYGHEIAIREDSMGYYKNMQQQRMFFPRTGKARNLCKVTDKEISQLQSIKEIFTQHNTDYKIILSPIYDQVPVEDLQINLLNKIFGKEHVYNFSGKNKLTEPIGNYYEYSHFRPRVANATLDSIYHDLKQKPILY